MFTVKLEAPEKEILGTLDGPEFSFWLNAVAVGVGSGAGNVAGSGATGLESLFTAARAFRKSDVFSRNGSVTRL